MFIFVSQVVNFGVLELNFQESEICFLDSVEGPPTDYKSLGENLGVVRHGSGIETSVLSYDGTSILTGARLRAA